MSSRKLSADQLKKFRSDVARLKAKGLTSKRVDARKQKPTKYMRRKVRDFQDVLSGKAKVVSVPKRAIAKEYSEKFRTVGKHVVVPVKPGENVAYSKKQNEITASRRVDGKRIKRRLSPKGATRVEAPISGNVIYTIPLGGTRQSFDTWEDLVLFMEPYEANPKNPYKEWYKYVEISEIEE